MKKLNSIQSLLGLAALALIVAGCATPNVNPPQAHANTGYVDFHATTAEELYWEAGRFDERSQSFQRVFSELESPPGGILRLAFAPGPHRLRVTFLNRAIAQPAEVEVQVQDGKITPVSITLIEAGVALIKTKEARMGGTAYGRRTKIVSDETAMYGLNAVTAPPATYQPKERMPYAR